MCNGGYQLNKNLDIKPSKKGTFFGLYSEICAFPFLKFHSLCLCIFLIARYLVMYNVYLDDLL